MYNVPVYWAPRRVHFQNGVVIGSAALAQLPLVIKRQTHTHARTHAHAHAHTHTETDTETDRHRDHAASVTIGGITYMYVLVAMRSDDRSQTH